MAKAIVKKAIVYDREEETFEYFYTLISNNGQVLAHSETYTRKANCLKVISKYFPQFEVVDNTKNKPSL